MEETSSKDLGLCAKVLVAGGHRGGFCEKLHVCSLFILYYIICSEGQELHGLTSFSSLRRENFW